ncbi:indole-3-acetic acid-induced protein arg7 [Phtheirospermum japonicum]|uniref:Indole-3-acetic acid-induced protein arg7 n=1 Tax=Phtheirospermum japonicum TaxID=374723 RepID=A0A830BBN2_9LAMI|nr:indole-3-acetic acid-induced protein arg7 [Phtheirospermum japonicum]
MERFVVPTSFLKNPLFVQLLDMAAEEYGFDNCTSRITLPCDEASFRRLVAIILSKK